MGFLKEVLKILVFIPCFLFFVQDIGMYRFLCRIQVCIGFYVGYRYVQVLYVIVFYKVWQKEQFFIPCFLFFVQDIGMYRFYMLLQGIFGLILRKVFYSFLKKFLVGVSSNQKTLLFYYFFQGIFGLILGLKVFRSYFLNGGFRGLV